MISSKSSKSKPKVDLPRYHTNIARSFSPHTPRRATSGAQNSVAYSHPPLPQEPSGLYNTLITDSDLALSKKKFVKVTSSGEVEMEPDIIEFCIQITTNKTDSEAKASIKKREDFVLAALKKFRVPEEDVKTSTIIKRYEEEKEDEFGGSTDLLQVKFLKELQIKRRPSAESNQNENNKENDPERKDKDKLIYINELCVKCDNLIKYLRVFSIINEKLDHNVNVSRPNVRFSAEHVQHTTQKAVKLAMKNGILKATELISTMRQRVALGRLYYSVEDSLVTQEVEGFSKGMTEKFETFSWKRLNKVVKCNLTSVFELEHPKTRKMI